MSSRTRMIVAGALLATCVGAGAATAGALDDIKARGNVRCSGYTDDMQGFASLNQRNEYTGLDIDLCRALALVVLGDARKATSVPVSWVQRFPALKSGDIDVVFKATTWTLSRDAELGFQFTAPYFFTGLGLMAHKDTKVEKAADLDGATVCTTSGTTQERAVTDYFAGLRKSVRMLTFEQAKDARDAYLGRRCDAFTDFVPGLAVVRRYVAKNPDEHVILPEFLEKEPLAAAVRQDDNRFLDVVNWMLFALLEAEELGITKANVDEKAKSDDPKVRQLLGVTPGVGAKLGLRDGWVRELVKEFGNYGELYNAWLGDGSELKLPRNHNRLWKEGGLLYSMPFN